MEYIAAQRKDYTNSILFCNVNDQNPTENKYYLIKVKDKDLKVTTYQFENASKEPSFIVDIDLNISSELDLDKFTLHDFKVAEKDD